MHLFQHISMVLLRLFKIQNLRAIFEMQHLTVLSAVRQTPLNPKRHPTLRMTQERKVPERRRPSQSEQSWRLATYGRLGANGYVCGQ
jgi:hypothetical protein